MNVPMVYPVRESQWSGAAQLLLNKDGVYKSNGY